MFKDAKASLLEMVVGLLWPISALLDWAMGYLDNWSAGQWFKAVQFILIVAAVMALFVEFRIDRPKDRAVQMAVLYTQMAQTHALANRKGLPTLRPVVLTLVGAGVPISRQNLVNLDLSNANLEGAVLNQTNLSRANLSGANLRDADLGQARLAGADLSGANLRGATNLEQSQIDEACVQKDGAPPEMPDLITPPSKVCTPVIVSANIRGIAHELKRGFDRVRRKIDRTIRDYDMAIRMKPDSALAYNNLAWLLATSPSEGVRDGDRAVKLAQHAVSLEEKANHFGTLAAAYARVGRFADAVAAQEQAISKLRADGGSDKAMADFQSRLSLYRAGQAYQQGAE
jgi:hypothetical protein